MDEQNATGRNGLPVIHKLHAKIGCLERRQSFLERSLAKHDAMQNGHPEKVRNENRASHDREEEAALRQAALPALKHFWRELQGEATASVLLASLVEALDDFRAAKQPSVRDAAWTDVEGVLGKARVFVEEERG